MPFKSSPGGPRNPFKKQQETSRNGQSPLSLTDRALVGGHSTAADDRVSENNDQLKPLDGETFVEWFSRNKVALEQQNPELTPSELTRHCVRTFKNIQSKNGTSSENSQKRKLEEEPNDSPITSAPKQSKLSAFAFQKKA